MKAQEPFYLLKSRKNELNIILEIPHNYRAREDGRKKIIKHLDMV